MFLQPHLKFEISKSQVKKQVMRKMKVLDGGWMLGTDWPTAVIQMTAISKWFWVFADNCVVKRAAGDGAKDKDPSDLIW